MVQLPGGVFILPALAAGILVSLIELFFVMQDEAGMHPLSHGIHAVPFTLLFTFLAFNATWALGLIGYDSNTLFVAGLRVLIGIIAFVKIKAAASLTGKGRIGESNMHLLIIMALIIGLPYLWETVLVNTPLNDILSL
jgi:hypothetical protein